jgi:hypothetical protein
VRLCLLSIPCDEGLMMPQGKPATYETHPLKDGSGFYVRVTWPDGRDWHVNPFETPASAARWIESNANEWLRKLPLKG